VKARQKMKRLPKRQMEEKLATKFSIPFAAKESISWMAHFGLKDKNSIEYMLYCLEQSARAGDAKAAARLAFIALDLANSLADIAQKAPATLQPYSRKCHAWPVVALAKELQPAHTMELFRRIQLGADALVELDYQTAKWEADDAGQVAHELLCYIQCARQNPKRFGKIGKLVNGLKDFCDDNAQEWWSVAKIALFETCPKEALHKDATLSKFATKWKKPRGAGQMQDSILRRLQSRFESLARNTAYST
jgi:hypothetical protein